MYVNCSGRIIISVFNGSAAKRVAVDHEVYITVPKLVIEHLNIVINITAQGRGTLSQLHLPAQIFGITIDLIIKHSGRLSTLHPNGRSKTRIPQYYL